MNIGIVDNQQIFREGLCRLIETENDINIIASKNVYSELDVEEIENIDILLIDIETLNEERALIRDGLISNHPQIKLVALSSTLNEKQVKDAILIGCQGFLLKEMSYPKFMNAVRIIHQQGAFIHPEALNYLMKNYQKLYKEESKLTKSLLPKDVKDKVCTKRENEILQLLVNGNDNNGIAKTLNISEKTVKNHLTNIFRKLDVKDRTQAAVLAIRNDWVEL